jgi:hypothetical protein
MKKNIYTLTATAILFATISLVSCKKDVAPATVPTPATPISFSFSEEFDNVGNLAEKGWLIKNNSDPTGANAWGQGRYENNLGGSKSGLVIGMPAYSANNSPFDFISVDATCVNTKGNVNCWLITPQTTVKNGDILTFYTSSMDDSQWSNFSKDRMQVRMNSVDGSTNCGTSGTDFGNFTKLLLDINPTYANNFGSTTFTAGYPEKWTKATITISGLTAPTKARFGFRYLAFDGGLSGATASSLIGVDKLEFKSN